MRKQLTNWNAAKLKKNTNAQDYSTNHWVEIVLYYRTNLLPCRPNLPDKSSVDWSMPIPNWIVHVSTCLVPLPLVIFHGRSQLAWHLTQIQAKNLMIDAACSIWPIWGLCRKAIQSKHKAGIYARECERRTSFHWSLCIREAPSICMSVVCSPDIIAHLPPYAYATMHGFLKSRSRWLVYTSTHFRIIIIYSYKLV